MSAFDFFAGFFHVSRTVISERTKSVLMDLVGTPDPTAPGDDTKAEVAQEQLAYGPLGLLVNPLDVGTMRNSTTPAQAEYLGIRTGDGVVPIVGWDPRIAAAFPNGPRKGTVALAGYAGGFHSIDLDDSGERNIHVLYVPIPGEPTSAHALILDGTESNKSVSCVHAFGQGWFLAPDGSVQLKNQHGTASIMLDDSGTKIFGNTVIAGGAVIGDATAVFAAKAPPIITYLTALEGLLNGIAGATVPPTTGLVSAFVAAQAATKAAIATLLTKVA